MQNQNQIVASQSLIALRQVEKNYSTPAGSFPALRDVDLEIGAGEFVALVGKSGSGKSTLLNLIGGLDRPNRGEVIVAGSAIHQVPENALARWRGTTVGVVFQFFQLLPTLTIAENVMLPMDFCNARPARERRDYALSLLEQMGIAEQCNPAWRQLDRLLQSVFQIREGLAGQAVHQVEIDVPDPVALH